MSWTRRFIYYPEHAMPLIEAVLPEGREISFTTADGLELGAWYLAGDPLIVVFHGNAGTRADRSDLALGLAERGMGVLLTDYRGYGGNPGEPTEEGLLADGRAALAWAGERAARVVSFGESLGSGVSVALAGEGSAAERVVLRSPFTSIAEIAAAWMPFGASLVADRWDSMARIAGVTAPLLVIAGTGDGIVPIAQSRALYQAAPGPKQMLEIPGADHNDWVLLAGAEVLDAVAAFAVA